MPKKLRFWNGKVLYVTPECKPLAKEGGIGDVAGELVPELKRQGAEVTVLMPLYGKIDRIKHALKEMEGGEFIVDYEGESERVRIFMGDFEGIQVILVQNERWFEKGEYGKIYVHSEKIPFWDDAKRFCFFSKCCLQLIKKWKPDVIHVSDWMLGFLLAYLKIEALQIRTILTIHNVCYQGNIWEEHILKQSQGLKDLYLHPAVHSNFKLGNDMNPLKLAIELADMVNTVSPTFAEEVTRPENQSRYFEGGKGLDEILKKRKDEGGFLGILNGFVYKLPPTRKNFEETLELKKAMKKKLGAFFKEPENFLVGLVGRAVDQKVKLLLEFLGNKNVLEHFLGTDKVNVAIVATGLTKYESPLNSLVVKRYEGALDYNHLLNVEKRDNYLPVIAFSPDFANMINLGSDLILMPSVFEPCGINQFDSMAKATPPLVRWTGGLIDTVPAYNNPKGAGADAGFGFDGSSQKEVLENLLGSFRRALEIYTNDPSAWEQIQWEGFQKRYEWSASAGRYINEMYFPAE